MFRAGMGGCWKGLEGARDGASRRKTRSTAAEYRIPWPHLGPQTFGLQSPSSLFLFVPLPKSPQSLPSKLHFLFQICLWPRDTMWLLWSKCLCLFHQNSEWNPRTIVLLWGHWEAIVLGKWSLPSWMGVESFLKEGPGNYFAFSTSWRYSEIYSLSLEMVLPKTSHLAGSLILALLASRTMGNSFLVGNFGTRFMVFCHSHSNLSTL
jgi:hypothetical protein